MSGLTKLTVNLAPPAAAALQRVTELNEETRTDAVNRAIRVYHFLSEEIAANSDLIIRDQAGNRKTIKLV